MELLLARGSYRHTGFFFLLLLLLPIIFPVRFAMADLACNATERELLSNAFANVAGFDISLLLPHGAACRAAGVPRPPSLPLQEIRLPARKLTGTVSWMVLRNISSLRVLDLSGNALRGSIPAGFWSAAGLVELDLSRNRLGGPVGFDPAVGRHRWSSSLRALNLSGNRFTNTVRLSGFPRLTALDLSENELRLLPLGIGGLAQLQLLNISGCNISGDAKSLSGLRSLSYLDASRNRMSGSFPDDFPPMAALKFLNISFNNFTGKVAPEQVRRFGVSAFANAGVSLRPENATAPSSSSSPQKRRGEAKRPGRALVWGLVSSAALLSVVAIAVVAACLRCRRRRTVVRKTNMEKKNTEVAGTSTASPPWVAELAAAGAAAMAAPVVVFEKPLMQLTFSELAEATSGFGVESQLAEGRRSGAVYRAVLPGELDVVVKVMEKARDVEAAAARAAFQDLGGLRHPNILPLLGYCIAGREKLLLLLYEYMDNGDLHRWLHELPAAGACTVDLDDWSTDTWEQPGGPSRCSAATAAAAGLSANPAAKEATAMEWETRHRIALGIARGLAFLHHAGSRPVVHGHLVSSNVLLDDDFEPKVADFGAGGTGEGGGSTAEDVFSYGSVLVELLTGRVGSPETVAWVRRLAREKDAARRCLDPRLRRDAQRRRSEAEEERAEKEMVAALRVAFLCTAESPEKRPSMRQVVGLIKDVRDTTAMVSDRPVTSLRP